MCMGGGSAAKRAAAEQAEAIRKLTEAQKAKTTDMVSKTAGVIQTNKDAKNRTMASLRIPIANKIANNQQNTGYGYGLNIPM